MLPTDLTVSAVVENNGKFLIVEERASGLMVLNLPGGHLEPGETVEQAAIRETMEETGCEISVNGLLGVYLWIHPQSRQQFLRIVYTGDLVRENDGRNLDSGVSAVHWFGVADLNHRSRDLRSPVVLRSVEDYLAGQRQPHSVLAGLTSVQRDVAAVMANACLV